MVNGGDHHYCLTITESRTAGGPDVPPAVRSSVMCKAPGVLAQQGGPQASLTAWEQDPPGGA